MNPQSSFEKITVYGQAPKTTQPDIFEANGYRAKEEELTSTSKWDLIEATEAEELLARGEPDIFHRVRIFRIIKQYVATSSID